MSQVETHKPQTRILLLHGYRQSSNKFIKSAQQLIHKAKKSNIEMICIDAPFKLKENDTGYDVSLGDQFKWWSFDSQKKVFDVQKYDTWKESAIFVQEIWQKLGPFDGILGFSQGSILAQILLRTNMLSPPPAFVILASPIGIHDDTLIFKEQTLEIPGLIVIGERDTLVPSQESLDILKTLPILDIVSHHGGHYIASTSKSVGEIISFIEHMQLSKSAKAQKLY